MPFLQVQGPWRLSGGHCLKLSSRAVKVSYFPSGWGNQPWAVHDILGSENVAIAFWMAGWLSYCCNNPQKASASQTAWPQTEPVTPACKNLEDPHLDQCANPQSCTGENVLDWGQLVSWWASMQFIMPAQLLCKPPQLKQQVRAVPRQILLSGFEISGLHTSGLSVMVSDGQFIFSPSSIPRPLLENFKNCLVLIILRLSRVTWSEKINLPGQLFEQVAHQISINVQIPILYLKNLVKQVLLFVLWWKLSL